MLTKEFVFSLFGGLGFFFFGMQLMSDGLKKTAGDKLKKVLHMATNIPVVGVIVGAAVTCLIQSSSATTVMVVGFVNAGLLALKQAICVVLGANIGTTVTAWLVSFMSVFKVTKYALPAVGLGFGLYKFGSSRKLRSAGEVILGFGILFIGLSFMKDAFEPLKDSEAVRHMFVALSGNPVMGVVIGVVFTILLQSSSATIAVVQVLAFNGLIPFEATLPIILGDNIGTTITAQLAAFGTNLAARRAAMSHTLFNVLGSTCMLILIYLGVMQKAIDVLIPGEITSANIMFFIAIFHTSFNVFNTVVFLPFVSLLEKASVMLVPKKKGAVEPGPQYLEKHLLDTPPIALEQAKNEVVYMLGLAQKSVKCAVESFIENNVKTLKGIADLEQAVDNLQSEITQYLVDLSQRELSEEETGALPVFIHSVNDIERIGDHSENIAELTERRFEEKLPFTNDAEQGMKHIWGELSMMMDETRRALQNDDLKMAYKVISREEEINKFQYDLKRSHVDRLNRGECNMKSGVVYLDFIDNLEKIGDHLTNIVQGVIAKMRWESVGKHKQA